MTKRKSQDRRWRVIALALALLWVISLASGIFQASSVAYANNPSLTVQQFHLYFGGVTAQQLVKYTRAFDIHYDASSTMMESIHALDPSYIGLVYRDLRKISIGSPELAEFAANSWFLKDQYGNYISSTNWGGRMVDVGNSGYQDWVAQWLLNETIRHQYNGVFLDDGFAAYPGEIWYDATSKPINPRTGTFWIAQEVRDAYVSMLNKIRGKLGSSRLIVANGIYDGNTWLSRIDAYKYVLDRININGIMGEGWWRHYPETTWFSESYWKASVDGLMQLESYFVKNSPTKMFIPVCYVTTDGNCVLPTGASKTQVARYGFASTLLGIQSSRDYLSLTNDATLMADYYNTMFSRNIGYPLGNYSVVSNTHVYQRLFSEALVLVNPTDTSYTVALNGTYTNLNGVNVSGTYTMPPHSGEILFHATAGAGANWWNSSWKYRMSITIDHTKVSSDQGNFPLLVDLANPTLTTKAQVNGQDFVFADVNDVKLDAQIESYNSATGHLVAWVRIPFLSSTVDTTIRLYYGNPTCADQQNATGVWDKNYLMVQHLNAKQTMCYDSTINRNNGTLYGSVAQTPGKIGGSYNFTGGYVALPQVYTGQTQFTFSAWIYARSGARYFISEWANNQGAFLQISGDVQVQLYVNGMMVAHSVSLNQWHYVVGTFDGTTERLWLDGGSPASVSASSPTWPSQSMYLGDRYDHQRRFNGLIDEVRVSKTARSNGWINTEYVNQNAPAAFYVIGSEESFPA